MTQKGADAPFYFYGGKNGNLISKPIGIHLATTCNDSSWLPAHFPCHQKGNGANPLAPHGIWSNLS